MDEAEKTRRLRDLVREETPATIAVAVGEESETLEEVHEPFLIQEGYLQRTPQGRVLTERGYAAVGLRPAGDGQGSLL